MAFLTGGANTLSSGDFVTNSLRISPSDDGFLERTTSGVSDSNRKTFTFSWWAKLSVGVEQHLYGFRVNADNMSYLRLNSDGQMRWANEDYQQSTLRVQTNRYFRDPSAWYHIVLRADTTQATETDRIRFYINGVEETSMATTDYPSQNYDTEINQADAFIIGAMRNTNGTTTGQVDGYLSEVHFADGQSYAPTVFGEYNDNGVWIPKDCKDDITYGTRGFYMQFKETGTSANSSGMGADTSGNDNHFTPNNLVAADITTDTPMNNFCTMSPIDTNTQASLSEGNTQLQQGSNYAGCNGTFGIVNGKWYWEVKTPTPTASGENSGFGVTKVPHATIGNNYLGINTNSWAIMIDNASSDILKIYNNSTTDYGVNASSNDIFQIALDMDNNKIYFGRNGSFFASGDPAGNSNEAYSSVSGDSFLLPAFSINANDTLQVNFGNPPYANSSSVADANGYGAFEFAPPSGFYALCSKNLAKYG